MSLDSAIKRRMEWMDGDGPHHQIVISSRVRLARNLSDHPFPGWAKKAERQSVLDHLRPAIEKLPAMEGGFSVPMGDLTPVARQVLVEKHLISREQAAKSSGSAIILSADQSVSIMINEEDHLRMQALSSGLQLREVFAKIHAIDLALEDRVEFAFDPRLGYLTACPTNVGTGIRASAMIHLPGLVLNEQINQIIQAVSKVHLAVRGLYGEGTEALGNLFQVSNQSTLGQREEEIIDHLARVIENIIGHERNARSTLAEKRPNMVYDHVGRAFGILSNAYSIASKEALNLLSILKLGIDLGFFPEPCRLAIDELFMETQPAHLQSSSDDKLSVEERDAIRAKIIRGKLKSFSNPAIPK
jgi:protein arginine kinase